MSRDEPRTPAEDVLEEHAGFVRRVALAVVGDESLADDVLQDTMVAAITRPPRSASSLRAWLGRVARNFALKTLRREGRFARRERLAARPEALESVASQVEREAMLRHVVDSVLELEEPYKSTVMMRFFEGLAAPEIARRQGVKASTVRTRLQRALEHLRGRLDSEYDGDRARWSAILLVTFTGSPTPPIPPGSSPAAPGDGGATTAPLLESGRALMTAGAKVGSIATAMVAMLFGAVIFLLQDPTPESDGDADVSPGVFVDDIGPAAGDSDANADDGNEHPSGAIDGDVNDGSAVISGEVCRLLDDTPAVDVEIIVFATSDEERRLRVARTGEGGTFRIALDHVDGPFRLEARSGNGPVPSLPGIALFPGQELNVGTLWISGPLGAAVTVVDEAGQPIAGAAVEAYPVRGRADARDFAGTTPPSVLAVETSGTGRATLDGLTAGRWTFRATHPDYAPGGVADVDVFNEQVGDTAQIVLERGAPLSGTVMDADGVPVAGVRIVAAAPRDGDDAFAPPEKEVLRSETVSAQDGSYRFPALARGTHSIGVASEGGTLARIWVIDVPSVERFDIQLRGGGIRGVVRDAATGRGLAGAVVHGAAWRAHHPTHWSATTDADGHYRMPISVASVVQGPPRGNSPGLRDVDFHVEKTGWVMVPDGVQTRAEGQWVAGTEFADWNVTMRRGAALSGTVAGPDGPLAGATVTADVWNAYFGSVVSEVTTDAEGRYAFAGLLDGRARLAVEKRGFEQVPTSSGSWLEEPEPPDAVVVVIPEAGAVRLDLFAKAARVLSGVVTDVAGGVIAGVRVESGRAFAMTDASGAFILRGVPRTGAIGVRASREGYGSVEEVVAADVPPDAPPLRLTLGARATVAGRVVDAGGGGSVEGAYVQVASSDELEHGRYMLVGIWRRSPKYPVGADGAFEVPVPIAVGRDATAVHVRAGAPGRAPAVVGRIDVAAGARVAGIDVRLDAGHTLVGRVVASDGSGPVVAATIEFVNAKLPLAVSEERRDMFNPGGRPFEIVAVTDDDGRFRIENLPEWNYELRVMEAAFLSARTTARVPGDGPLTIELPIGATMAGVVQIDDGTPASGGQVVALRADGSAAGYARTDDRGRFRFEGLAHGEYRLRVEAAPYCDCDILAQDFEELVATGTEGIVLVATRGKGTISGTCVIGTGATVAGVFVSAKPMAGGASVRTRSDAGGKFTLRGLSDARYALVVVSTRGPGSPSEFAQRYSLEFPDVAVGTSDLKLPMLPTIAWSGVVVREDGEPLPHGTLIQLREAPASPWRHMGRIGPGGAFTFATVRSVPYDVIVLDPATGQRLVLEGGPLFTPTDAPARLVVPAGDSISGVVVADGGRPVPEASVSLRTADGRRTHAITDIDGRFQVTGIEGVGPFEIVAGKHAHGRATIRGVRTGDTGVRLELRPSDPLVVRLVDADGDVQRSVIFYVMQGDEVVARMRTDATGVARSLAIPPGTYAIVIDGSEESLGNVTTGSDGNTLSVR